MRRYIVNLTDHLIRKNRYDQVFQKLGYSKEFAEHVKLDLEIGDVSSLSPAKLGEIMCSFEVGDVMAGRSDLLPLVGFSGDCGAMLRELVATCLAYAIKERFADINQTDVPRYTRAPSRMRTEEVLNELDARFRR